MLGSTAQGAATRALFAEAARRYAEAHTGSDGRVLPVSKCCS